jgi:hypothetical protein
VKAGSRVVRQTLPTPISAPLPSRLPELLNQLKAAGYKIVHTKAKEPVKTIAQYDELLAKEVKLPTVSARPRVWCARSATDPVNSFAFS